MNLVYPVIDTPYIYRGFDEWGEKGWGGLGNNYSFSYILHLSHLKPDISLYGNSLFQDSHCCQWIGKRDPVRFTLNCSSKDSYPAGNCGYCRMTFTPSHVTLQNMNNSYLPLCHFQYAKKILKTFEDENAWRNHLKYLKKQSGTIVSSFRYGLQTL